MSHSIASNHSDIGYAFKARMRAVIAMIISLSLSMAHHSSLGANGKLTASGSPSRTHVCQFICQLRGSWRTKFMVSVCRHRLRMYRRGCVRLLAAVADAAAAERSLFLVCTVNKYCAICVLTLTKSTKSTRNSVKLCARLVSLLHLRTFYPSIFSHQASP